MDSQKSDIPWSKKIDFEVTLSSERYLCYLIKDYFSMLGGEVEPSLKTACFDIKNGVPCTLYDFAVEGVTHENLRRSVVNDLLCPEVSSFFFNGQELTDEQRNLVFEIFNAENFYLTESGIGFYLDSYIINPRNTSVFKVNFDWNEVGFILKLPK